MHKPALTPRLALLVIGLLLVAGTGVWMLKAATPYGLGLRNDSVQYIFGARNLLDGNGYTRTSGGGELKPISTVPPLFSVAISAVSLAGMDALRAARLLSFGLFGLNILLLGTLAYRLTRRWWLALAAAALMGWSAVFLSNFAWLMSEPLFICLWLSSFIIYDIYLQHPHRGWLLLLGVLTALAYLTRYIGLSLAATFCLAALLFEPGWRRKIGAAILTGLPFLLAFAGWSIRNQLVIGNPANRTLLAHLVTPEKIFLGIDNFWEWLLPDGLSTPAVQFPIAFRILFLALFLAGVAALVVAAWRFLRRPRPAAFPGGTQMVLVFGLSALVYVLLTLTSMSFVDASTILDQRLMMPFYLPVLLLLVSALAAWFARGSWISRSVVVLLALAWVAFNLAAGLATVRRLGQDGLGFSSLGVRQSPTVRYIQSMPPRLIYTNKAYMLYIVTGREAYMLTGPVDSVTGQPRPDYAGELDAMWSAVQTGQAVLVFFKDAGYASDPWFLEITRGLAPVAEYYDAIVYGAGP